MTVSEIFNVFGVALKFAQSLIEKIEDIQDENEKAKIKDAMDRNDLDALRALLWK